MQPGLVSPVFVGRAAELSSLVASLESAIAGEPAVVLVGGGAGVGKTRLVEEAAARARAEGPRVLTGSCIEVGGEGLPLGPDDGRGARRGPRPGTLRAGEAAAGARSAERNERCDRGSAAASSRPCRARPSACRRPPSPRRRGQDWSSSCRPAGARCGDAPRRRRSSAPT